MSDITRRSIKRPAALLLAALFMLLALSGCSNEPEIVAHQGPTMGTSFSVKWVSSDASVDATLPAQIDQLLVDINHSMSTYQDDSELSRINQMPAGESVMLSKGLTQVLKQALEISHSSGGAFDVTVGPLVNLWGFGPDGRIIRAPADADIQALRQRVGYHYINLSGQKLTRERNVYIDLSAIAKGYGVDKVAELLETAGITAYLVEIGGELRARGTKPDGSHWKIAIEAPVSGERQVQRIIKVNNIGIATSGDYRNYFEEDGIRFSHTINPVTGKPIDHKLASVTVLAKDCATADALATAMMVLGPDKAEAYAEEQGVEALMIIKSDEGFVEIMTPGFANYLVE
ncbi:FAD:protein FMN transferase [Amphritea sp. 2_MG-2023]|uniref:FAD:protein FMN transferase n=1 Tax=Amphritea TaxID=515417 RepID=UPI001C0669F7|nr:MULTISPECIES: FAD:protein FMN transferase [Amphritea]MBU2966543.1 FAD:protein FMN transferase [Amphritea atlantica]MDO6417598.1 FAD:protein FMN transferase [Amphritea sp. 2_MG-2023]